MPESVIIISMKRLATALLLIALTFPLAFAKPADSAAEVLKAAQAKAKAERKNVMVIFHASWCGWCKKMDEFMERPEFKKIFDANYVIVHLTVMENEAHKSDENAGGMDVMKSAGGENQGIPFYYISDPNGKMLINSRRKNGPDDEGSNIGHPAKPEEVDHFILMLRKTAPRMTGTQIESIKKFLLAQKF